MKAPQTPRVLHERRHLQRLRASLQAALFFREFPALLGTFLRSIFRSPLEWLGLVGASGWAWFRMGLVRVRALDGAWAGAIGLVED